MLQSVKRAMKLDSSRPEVHDCLSRLHTALAALKEENGPVSKVLNKAAQEVSMSADYLPGMLLLMLKSVKRDMSLGTDETGQRSVSLRGSYVAIHGWPSRIQLINLPK